MMFDPNTLGEVEGAAAPLAVPIPFLRGPKGLGDLVKGMAEALHIPQCEGCKGRQDRMNRAVRLTPARSLWED